MAKTIVLYPGLAVSHFVPMMQLADALLEEGYAVTVALIDPVLKGDIALAAMVDRVASSKPSVAFHRLPPIQDPPAVIHDGRFLVRYLDLVSRHTQHLHHFLRSMPPGSVRALIADMMSVGHALGASSELGIPAYTFFPSNASALAASVQVSMISEEEGQPGLGELGDTPLDLCGVPPMPASCLVSEMLQKPGSELYTAMMNMIRGMQQAKGILVNTFASLEARAVGALSDPRCFPEMPPVYCVGPLVAETEKGEEKHECLSWLDRQPERSVVFLCFGSIGLGDHSEDQLREIAVGLERSGHRFLWVVRAPPDDDPEKTRADPDLDAILPEGFLERTGGRGLIVKKWAPQVEVLRHKATGAFVMHGGWNSVMEGIMAGVPMLCWPLHSEQMMNKVVMVEEFRIGVEVSGSCRHGLVEAKEVEAKVRLVLDSEEGERLRARMQEQREAAAMAWDCDGSSRAAFEKFLSDTAA